MNDERSASRPGAREVSRRRGRQVEMRARNAMRDACMIVKTPEATRSVFEDDPQLLAAFRSGTDSALALIYRRHAGVVGAYLAFLARATGALELAQSSAVADLQQEVFARAFSVNARKSYDDKRPFGPYLNRIAKNCFVDLLRKLRRDLARDLHDPASFERAFCADDDEFGHALLAVVHSYVSELSDSLREVYEQRFEIGLTQKAACDALGITRRALRTAETHLVRGAREALCIAGVLTRSETRDATRKTQRRARKRRRSARASSTKGSEPIPA